jgi:hypothetical protein
MRRETPSDPVPAICVSGDKACRLHGYAPWGKDNTVYYAYTLYIVVCFVEHPPSCCHA